MKTLEERINCDARGRSPIRRSSDGPGRAHVQLTMRRIAVWRRVATENIAKKVIVKGIHDIIPNYVAGGMDATEGTYVWNHTMRSCPEEEWEELYKGKLGILEDEVITLDRLAGQRAWLKLEKGVTVWGGECAVCTFSTCMWNGTGLIEHRARSRSTPRLQRREN
jgi:hypothetical protein